MRSVGLKVLKNKLSEYVRLAAAGETVLVTDRDHVVAELVPPREGRSPLLADAMLANAVRNGWLTPPRLREEGPPPRKPIAPTQTLLAELAEDRAERSSTSTRPSCLLICFAKPDCERANRGR
jgi:antitoxin (DNA-binding transcriptional repressor) of toxin-antitoxin stability system